MANYLEKTIKVVVNDEVVDETSNRAYYSDSELQEMKDDGFAFVDGETKKRNEKADKKIKGKKF